MPCLFARHGGPAFSGKELAKQYRRRAQAHRVADPTSSVTPSASDPFASRVVLQNVQAPILVLPRGTGEEIGGGDYVTFFC